MPEESHKHTNEGPEVRSFRDRFFQDYFGNAEASRGVLQCMAPEELDSVALWHEMELIRGSWIAPNLQWRANDLFWRVPLKGGGEVYFYVLWEHQTQVDKWIALRLLVYMVLAWWSMMKRDESKPKKNLPLILPVVLYQGEEEWNFSACFSGLLDWLPFVDEELREILERKTPEFEFEVMPLMDMPEADLPQDLLSHVGLTLMQAVTRDQPLEWFHAHADEVNTLLHREDGEAIFITILHYVGYAMHGQNKDDELQQTVKTVTKPELEKKTMNAIEQFELRGEKRGLERGLERGEKRAKIKIVHAMLNEGMETDAICRLASVDAEFVTKVESGELHLDAPNAKPGEN